MTAIIRAMCADDMDIVLDIWLQASIKAHHFVAADVWQQNLTSMRNQYLPAAENYVYQDESNEVIGFFSLYQDCLAAIFVLPEKQGNGIGSKLLQHAKSLRTFLTLTVYAANEASVGFYLNAGFSRQAEQTDSHTGQPEYLMQWDEPSATA